MVLNRTDDVLRPVNNPPLNPISAAPMNPTHSEYAIKVLIVDDDEAIQVLMSAIFRRQDVVVDLAGDGQVALDRLRHRHYDAIVLDLMLPIMNGFDVIRHLKVHERDVLERTIVLTAASDYMLRNFSDADLVRRVMRKPFDLGELVAEVLACRSHSTVSQMNPLQHHAH